MKVPCRVLRGTGGSGGAYYWDGVNPMTVLSGGIGGLLIDNDGFDVPTNTLTIADFDAFQAHLLGRKSALDQLAACETCPQQKVAAALDGGEETVAEHAAAVLGALQAVDGEPD